MGLLTDEVLPGDAFAFYGILMEDRALEASGEYLGGCLIPGALWDTGSFPALTECAGDAAAVGRLWLPDPDALDLVVPSLDALEGHTGDPETSMYVRRWTALTHPAVLAWVYYWALPTGRLTRLPGGRWTPHRRTNPTLTGGTRGPRGPEGRYNSPKAAEEGGETRRSGAGPEDTTRERGSR